MTEDSPKGRVLVVDDDESILRVTRAILAQDGHDVVVARDGYEALDVFARARPEVVLLDVLMPGLDGFATCRRLRGLRGGDRVGILFVTSLSGADDYTAALASGADDYLTKPIQRGPLLLRVRSLLRLRRATNELEAHAQTIRSQRDELILARARREQLISVLVDDLREPLETILSSSAELLDAANDADLKAGVVLRLDDACEIVRRSVSELDAVSSTSRRRVAARLQPVDLGSLIAHAVAAARRRNDDIEASIDVALPSPPPTTVADRDLIQRALANLLDNALSYSPPGGCVYVTLHVADEERVVIAVEDEGDGVPEELRDAIFEPPQGELVSGRLRQPLRQLGLPFCRLALQALGGDVAVSDANAGGARFELVFPLREPDEHGRHAELASHGVYSSQGRWARIGGGVELAGSSAERQNEDDASSIEGAKTATTRDREDAAETSDREEPAPRPQRLPGHVAIVDPDPELLAEYRGVLQGGGNDVTICETADMALRRIDEAPLDAVVSEVALPDISGLTLMRKLHERDPDLPVILTAEKPEIETAMAALESGAIKYLIKPIAAETLRETTERAMHLGRLTKVKRKMLEHRLGSMSGIADPPNLEESLDSALRTMWLAWQPIVRMPDEAVFAYEALLRSDEPSLPHPGAVLDAAERLSRVRDVGRSVRRLVAREAGACPDEIRVFVNIHPSDLDDPDLLDDDAGLNNVASRVVFEITERAGIDSLGERLVDVVGRARDLGYTIAVDDLGSGYAGLTSFARLGPEIVKLDMSLVRDVNVDSTRQRLIRSMIELCSDLGIELIAEGVETDDELACLAELGCRLFQGYLFQRPGPGFVNPFVA